MALTPSVDGFTPLPTPSAGTRIAYVTEGGNDSTGAVVNASSVTDPFNPTSGENPTPFATFEAAYAALRDGEPDWLLMKRGDEWAVTEADNTFHIDFNKSGKSNTERLFIGAFGAENLARPKITMNGAFKFLRVGSNSDCQNWDFRSIEFAGGTGNTNSQQKVFEALVLSPSNVFGNVLIEDVFFNALGGFQIEFTRVLATSTQGYSNVAVRRCISHDCAHGSWLFRGYAGLLVEENIFTRSGYREDVANPGAAQGPQCLYLQEEINTGRADLVTTRGNVFVEVATSAIQARAGGLHEANLFVKCPIALSPVGRNNLAGGGLKDALVRWNAIIEGTARPGGFPNSKLGYGIEMNKCDGAECYENILSENEFFQGPPYALRISSCENTTIRNNIVRNWHSAIATPPNATSSANVIRDNVFWTDLTPSCFLVTWRENNANLGNYSFLNNSYWNADANQNNWFSSDVVGVDDFSDWVSVSGETGSIVSTDPWTRSGDATSAAWFATVGGITDLASWRTALAAQRRGNWDESIMAYAAVDWFRDGFGLSNLSDPPAVENAAPAWSAIPRTTIAEEDSTTIALTSYVTDPDGDNLTFAAVGTWPAWVTLSGSTVTIAPTAGLASATPFEMTVRATDDGDPIRTSDATFSVTVTEPAGEGAPSGGANVPEYDMAIVSFVFFNGGKG